MNANIIFILPLLMGVLCVLSALVSPSKAETNIMQIRPMKNNHTAQSEIRSDSYANSADHLNTFQLPRTLQRLKRELEKDLRTRIIPKFWAPFFAVTENPSNASISTQPPKQPDKVSYGRLLRYLIHRVCRWAGLVL
ncbi:hypothetical protein KR009_005529 [Drosophila setifemur]|nr:hypothetical protein KR009_005529 [Drosophila setifemur]